MMRGHSNPNHIETTPMDFSSMRAVFRIRSNASPRGSIHHRARGIPLHESRPRIPPRASPIRMRSSLGMNESRPHGMLSVRAALGDYRRDQRTSLPRRCLSPTAPMVILSRARNGYSSARRT